LVTMSQRYEASGPFNTGAGGGTADYVFALFFATVMIILTYPLVLMMAPSMPLFTSNLVYFVLYIWSKRHPTAQANIWGVPVPAVYLPFAYLALTTFMGGSIVDMVHGLSVGHLYYFLVEVVPRVHGKDVLRTPQFLIDQFGVGEYRAAAPIQNPAEQPRAGFGAVHPAQPAAGGHTWGTAGRPLGRD
jgi:Derlin-2/3